jgi:acyl-coenzyme A synthetase/AMP-(fatty) acid ligase
LTERWGASILSSGRARSDYSDVVSLTNPFLYLQRNADDNPNGVFSRSADQTVTNAEALVSVKKLAYELRRLGVRAGDVVALELPDQLGILFTEALYHEGAISTVLPEGYSTDGVFQLDWVFSSRPPRPQRAARLVVVDSRFLRQVDENPYGISPSEAEFDTLRIAFSSGTTGIPNAIPLTRTALQSFDDALDSWFQGDPFLVLMDLGTPWGFGGFYLSVKGGRPFLSVGGASPDAIVRVAAENSVTSLKGSPAQIAGFVDELEAQNRILPSIESVWFGGTLMPPGVAERVRRATDGCDIHGMYGSTEAMIATSRLYETEDPSNAGWILPDSQVEIVDEDDQPLPVGTAGRVRHRSPGMVHEYLGNPEATARAFRDGWFYSGDLGLIRPDGGLTLTGRESEVLNAGGVKIDPNRLDHFALENPKVIDACSFEYATASGIRQIGIALVTADDLDVPALVEDLTTEFGNAAPKLVARVDSIPRTATGKPMRRTLAERYTES